MENYKVVYTLKNGNDIYDIVQSESFNDVMNGIVQVLMKSTEFIITHNGGFRTSELLGFKVYPIKI